MTTIQSVTIEKMLESLPREAQDRVLDHMRDFVADLQDELKWNEAYARSENNLTAAARKAKKEIKEGKAKPFSSEML